MLRKTAQGISLGHEFSGYIEDLGTFALEKGARVCTAEFNPCGKCKFCQSGLEELCIQMMVDNPGVTMNSAFSEYVRARGDFVCVLLDDVPMKLGANTESAAVSLYGV